MSFKQQGKTNLNIATYLNDKNMDKIRQMSKQELASVIINRLYYGVFLLAKELIKQDSSQVPSHNHQLLWRQVSDILGQKQNNFDKVGFVTMVDKIRTTRNTYDYDEYLTCNIDKINNDIEICFGHKQEIYDTLCQYI